MNENRLNKLLLMAMVEHFRTHLSSEASHIENLRRGGERSRSLDRMLSEFNVARTLSKYGRERLDQELDDLTDVCRNQGWETILYRTKGWGPRPLKKETVGPRERGKPRDFVSGITKVLWFTGGHKQPMFDRYTSKALRARGKTKAAEAIDFYKKLEEAGFSDLRSELQEILDDHELPWHTSAERTVDKALFILGIEKSATATFDLLESPSLSRYLNALAKRPSIESAADRITELILGKREFFSLLREDTP